MRDGLKKMKGFNPPLVLSEDEFDTMTFRKALCNVNQVVYMLCDSQVPNQRPRHRSHTLHI